MTMILLGLVALICACRVVEAVQRESVLITGASGFIGSQLQKHLLEMGVHNVTGLDKFDVYYPVPLKWSRVEDSKLSFGANVIEADVCDAAFLHDLLRSHAFTHIIHLAAQAGVRYSINHPLKYIRDNIECFTILLEQIRLYGDEFGRDAMPKLIYASSSSVYGANTKIPFAEIDPVEKPSNVYGATKRMDELLAYAYYNLYGIKSIGLRFFTVYGPWGRPDMAAWKFSEQILKNETITVFNQGKMKRDFTFVNDTIRGIAACMHLEHTEPEVFNLGNHQAVETMYFLELIEKSLGKKAKVRFEDSKAEIAVTYANTTHAYEKLGFKAVTSIETGLEKFAQWFQARQVKTIQCESGCSLDRAFVDAGQQGPAMCGKSVWAEAAEKTRDITKGCETVLYMFLSHADRTASQHADLPAHCQISFVVQANGQTDAVAAEGWTAVAVPVPPESSAFYEHAHIPRMAPWLLFAPSVRYAVGQDSRRVLSLSVADLLASLRGNDTGSVSDGSGLSASILLLRNSRVSNLYEEAHLNLGATHQVAAYREYELREGLNYDNVFDPELVVFDLHNAVARDFACDWYREAQEWHPHNGSGQLAGAYVLARRMKETAEAAGDHLPQNVRQHLSSSGKPEPAAGQSAAAAVSDAPEWIPVAYQKDAAAAAKVSYIRILPGANVFHPHKQRTHQHAPSENKRKRRLRA